MNTRVHATASPLLLAALACPSALGAQTGGGTGGDPPVVIDAVETQLAGNPLGSDPADYPHFEYVQSFNEGSSIWIAVDPFLFPQVVGVPVDVYVVASRAQTAWFDDPTLVDLTGGAQAVTFAGTGIQDNTLLVDAGNLNGQGGLGVGIAYDVVIDLDRDGSLSHGDLIDGLTSKGFHVVQDLTLPGPLDVATPHLYAPGTAFGGQIVYYPTDIATLGSLPLVVISHGNGHNFQWYGHIGHQLASYGYVVVSHENDTGPGIETASQTTLDNTDDFLTNLAGLPALQGHVDSSRIIWIGHSRGGQGVVRAYQRLSVTSDPNPASFSTYGAADIVLIASMAPTSADSDWVYLGPPTTTRPGSVTYCLLTGAADKDVKNCPKSSDSLSFLLYERAEQTKMSIALYGAGHDDFHDGQPYVPVAKGPCLVGRSAAHAILRGYLVPLVKFVVDGEEGAKDYLWRQWERFRPIGAPTVTCSDPDYSGQESVTVNLMLREGSDEGTFVLDDFNTQPAPTLSSALGAVWTNAPEFIETTMEDTSDTFLQRDPPPPNTPGGTPSIDPVNGINFAVGGAPAFDQAGGAGFSFASNRIVAFQVPLGDRDLTDFEFLSFRAAQVTRHPNTVAPDLESPPRWEGYGELGDLAFSVRLRTNVTNTRKIRIANYGGGLEEPYQRRGCNTPPFQAPVPEALPGWATEFETIRIRLTDFIHNDSGIDLSDVQSVEFLFGPAHGSDVGRVFLDDIQFERN